MVELVLAFGTYPIQHIDQPSRNGTTLVVTPNERPLSGRGGARVTFDRK